MLIKFNSMTIENVPENFKEFPYLATSFNRNEKTGEISGVCYGTFNDDEKALEIAKQHNGIIIYTKAITVLPTIKD